MRSRFGLVWATLTLSLALCCVGSSPVAAGLVGYWSFDGCTTTDGSGNGHDLSAGGGPACTPGRFGAAWHLNGTDQFLDRSFDAAFTPGSRAWSVAAWVKSTQTTGDGYVVEWYRCGANPGCTAVDAAYYIMWIMNGHPHWDLRDDEAHEIPVADTTLNLADGAWHLMVGTMNPATSSARLYVDGALRGEVHASIGSLSSGSVSIPLEVGRHFRTGWGLPDFYFPGDIDEVRIFDNELDPASVAGLYTNNTIAGVIMEGTPELSIDGLAPNPSRGGRIFVTFTLPAAERARLSVFDIGGRLIALREVGSLGAGQHRIEVGEGQRPAPGIYVVRLTQGARSSVRRLSVLN